MNLSGLIFVALFVGWAIYLIPKIMRDHHDLASTRTLQDFSERVRVFAVTRRLPPMDLYGADEPTIEIAMDEVKAVTSGAVALRVAPPRAVARGAARRRRRVLVGLLALTVAFAALAYFAYLPEWTPIVPGLAVALFMASARRAVRRAHSVRSLAMPERLALDAPPVMGEIVEEPVIEIVEAVTVEEVTPVVVNQLWDPVPMTLPTYLDKPAARRTVMSIELNQGVVSSGHDAADSELVRAAEAAARAADLDDTPVDLEAPLRAAGA